MGQWLHPVQPGSGGITGDSIRFEDADTDDDNELSESELQALTISQIKAIAEEKGYTITATRKADIIAEFLAAQEAAS